MNLFNFSDSVYNEQFSIEFIERLRNEKKFKSLNAQMDIENDRMIYKNYFNIGIAVDTDKGLVVPVIRDADKKSIIELAKDVNDIIEKSRTGNLSIVVGSYILF